MSTMEYSGSRTVMRRPGSGVDIEPAKLTWLRESRAMTRQDLSDRIAEVSREQDIRDHRDELVTFSRDGIAKLENGERKPKMPTFVALCAALSCEARQMLRDFPGTAQPRSRRSAPYSPPAGLPASDRDPLESLRGLISTRAYNSLNRTGFTTVGEVAAADQDGVLRDVRNLGPTQLAEIRSVLVRMAARDADSAAEAS